eukprot:m.261845 g.261845  ORF g.261845 m.261845 type:complete len:341 (-) comp19225_c1_seq35:240-1262(-)
MRSKHCSTETMVPWLMALALLGGLISSGNNKNKTNKQKQKQAKTYNKQLIYCGSLCCCSHLGARSSRRSSGCQHSAKLIHSNMTLVEKLALLTAPPFRINRECVERGIGSQFWCINAAIEATSLNTRALCRLPAQDRLIRDRIGADDVLVVSVGGNDIALQPLLATVASTCCLVCCTTRSCLQHGTACPPNIPACDCGCLCCGLPACLQNCLGWPCGLGYMVDLFKNRVENYVRRLVEVTRPSKVVVCMIYFPDEAARDSWAGAALSCLRYNTNPDKLQLAIRKVFELATSNISIPGTEVVAFPLYRALDGTDTRDYVHRVEPSALGGSKMAAKLLDAIL